MPFFVVHNYSNMVARLPDLESHLYNSNIVYPPLSTVASPERFLVRAPPGFWLSVSPFNPSTSSKLLANTHLLPCPLTTNASADLVCPYALRSHVPSILVIHPNHFSTSLLQSHQHKISIQRGV